MNTKISLPIILLLLSLSSMIASCQDNSISDEDRIQQIIEKIAPEDCDLRYREELSEKITENKLVVRQDCGQFEPSLFVLSLMDSMNSIGRHYGEYRIEHFMGGGETYSLDKLKSVKENLPLAMSSFKRISEGKVNELMGDIDTNQFIMEYFGLLDEHAAKHWSGNFELQSFNIVEQLDRNLLRIIATYQSGYCSLVIDLNNNKIINIQ